MLSHAYVNLTDGDEHEIPFLCNPKGMSRVWPKNGGQIGQISGND
jgi:hypothetical protein